MSAEPKAGCGESLFGLPHGTGVGDGRGSMSGSSTEDNWYIAREGQQHGPISDAEMRLFVDNGHLKPGDLVWRPGFADWRPAASVFQSSSAPAPQQQAAPQPAASAPAAARQPMKPAEPAPSHAEPSRVQPAASPGDEASRKIASMGAGGQQARSVQTPGGEHRPAQSTGATPHSAGHYPASPKHQPQTAATNSPQSRQARQPVSIETDPHTDAYQIDQQRPAPNKRSAARLVMAGLLMAMIGGSLAYIITNKDAILSMAGVGTSASGEVPLIKSGGPARTEGEATNQTAALQNPAPIAPLPDTQAPAQVAPPPGTLTTPQTNMESSVTPTATAPVTDTSAIDAYYQKSDLWQYMKRNHPDWYKKQIDAAAGMAGSENGMPPRAATKGLVDGLVALRRENAEAALQSDSEKLKGIARAFLKNLESLAAKSSDTCYAFISQGESSPDSIDLFHHPASAPALEGQAIEVFRAIDAGKATP
ncbi:MAG: GYF domain-containing protein, partial [Hyphomicrobiaceae bacterium]